MYCRFLDMLIAIWDLGVDLLCFEKQENIACFGTQYFSLPNYSSINSYAYAALYKVEDSVRNQ